MVKVDTVRVRVFWEINVVRSLIVIAEVVLPSLSRLYVAKLLISACFVGMTVNSIVCKLVILMAYSLSVLLSVSLFVTVLLLSSIDCCKFGQSFTIFNMFKLNGPIQCSSCKSISISIQLSPHNILYSYIFDSLINH